MLIPEYESKRPSTSARRPPLAFVIVCWTALGAAAVMGLLVVVAVVASHLGFFN